MEFELVRALNDLLPLLGANVVCDLDAVLLVVHQEHLEVRTGAHDKLVETILDPVAGLLVRPVANARHESRALEAATDAPVDAARLTPSWVHALEAVGLETGELLQALLHDLAFVSRRRHSGESTVLEERVADTVLQKGTVDPGAGCIILSVEPCGVLFVACPLTGSGVFELVSDLPLSLFDHLCGKHAQQYLYS